jgi:hypothetical protein
MTLAEALGRVGIETVLTRLELAYSCTGNHNCRRLGKCCCVCRSRPRAGGASQGRWGRRPEDAVGDCAGRGLSGSGTADKAASGALSMIVRLSGQSGF